MLALFHDKKCCKCIKLFPCILWDFIVLGLTLSWWKIEHEMKISVVSWLTHKKFVRKVSLKRAREKHMLEAEESSTILYFASTSWLRPFREVPVKLFAWRIFSVTFLPFTHTIYTLITYRNKEGLFREKTLDRFL